MLLKNSKTTILTADSHNNDSSTIINTATRTRMDYFMYLIKNVNYNEIFSTISTSNLMVSSAINDKFDEW